MDINNILKFFYQKASIRIEARIKESNLTYYQIHRNDTKQLSRIVNYQKDFDLKRNNPFLINNSVMDSSYQDEVTSKMIPCGLLNTPELKFDSKKDILWGTDEEISSYLQDLFILLWNEVTAKESTYGIDPDVFLFDYIPYAKYSAYWEILFSQKYGAPISLVKIPEDQINKHPAIIYGIYEDDVISNIEPAKENALLFLYHNCKDDFQKCFLDFTKRVDSFHKINKVFQKDFIETSFLSLLEKHTPNASSLGLRVYNLIKSDIKHCASLLCNPTNDDSNYKRTLVNASSQYIFILENLQEKSRQTSFIK